MPLIFGLLIILNAVFMAWQFFQQQNNAAEPVPPPTAAMGKPLQLLSESSVPKQTQDASQDNVNTPSLSQPKNSDTCFRVGPVTNPDMTSQIEAALEKAGFGFKVESLTQENTNFWVYIPPQLSLTKANLMLADLNAKGFKGELVSDQQFANAISMGEFRDADRANALKARLLENGFLAETRKSPIVKRQQWVRVSGVSIGSRPQLDRIIAGGGLRKEPASCEL